MAASSRPKGKLSKLECFTRFDEVNFWHSRTRDLIANAKSYSYPAFLKFFRGTRRESRRAEFKLVVALYKFQREIEEQLTNADKP